MRHNAKITIAVALIVLLTVNLFVMCSCSEKTVEVWRLVKEYDIEGLEFADFESVAESFDEEKYIVKVNYEPQTFCDTLMTIMPKSQEYRFVANIKKYSSVSEAEKNYKIEIKSVGPVDAVDAIVRVNDMMLTGNGFIVKMFLEGIGIETHDTVTVPSGSRLKRVDDLVPFDKVEMVLKDKGYVFYSDDDKMVYNIYSPDGSEYYLILRFLLPETDERAYEAAKRIYFSPEFASSSGVNVYYCNTYAVRCIGDQWIKLTEGILE